MHNTRAKLVSFFVVAWIFSLTLAKAQRPDSHEVETPLVDRQLSVRDLLTTPSFPSYLQFKLSPGGDSVAYTVELGTITDGSADVEAPSLATRTLQKRTEIRLTHLATGKTERICCKDEAADFPSWSPDGKYLAFYTTKSGSVLSPMGDGSDDLVVWHRETGETQKYMAGLVAPPITLTPPLWLEDSTSVLVFTQVVHQPSDGSRSEQQGQGTPQTDKPADPTVRVLVTRSFNDQNNSAKSTRDQSLAVDHAARFLCDIVTINVVSGQVKAISSNVNPNARLLSPDHETLFYSVVKRQEDNSFYQVSDVRALDLATAKDREVLSGVRNYGGYIQLSCSPSGRFLAFPDAVRTDTSKDEQYTDFVLVPTSGGPPSRMKADHADHLAAGDRAVWSKDGKWVSFVRANSLETWDTATVKRVSRISITGRHLWDVTSTKSDHTLEVSGPAYSLIVSVQDLGTLQEGFWRVLPGSGKAEQLLEDDETIPNTGPTSYQELLPDGSGVLIVRQSAYRPAELFEADTNLEGMRQITHLASALDGVAMGRTDLVTWLDDDARESKGVLLLPPTYRTGRRYPLVVVVYPNPDIPLFLIHRFGMPFAINAQLLATRGYAILLVGARVCPDTRMQDIFKSVLPGIHSVIESGIADPERIGVMGQSDGGYAALALLVQSKIFKAAVITSGYSNILTLESYDQGRSIMRESEDFTATAWHDRHIAIENSPYFYLNRVQTPTLMTHGGDDNSIPEASVKELFGAFQDLGKEAVFVEYEGEGHGPLYYSYEHQVDLSGRIVQWFDKYLKGQSK